MTMRAFPLQMLGPFSWHWPRIAKYFDWLTAGVFASLGVRLAVAQR
ncbi:hypothetical protein Gura_1427 [Geotalea uraniireducens Rf4]|uniref:Uncharacterized protein n=1 Tax=Geotalea uraniireducens (strain Rf4) TaxID=351605 RepID=A5G9X6_GEOUR|nr:hypothetical protein Gura_1427 [Geotalea uraniireducens Rf4]